VSPVDECLRQVEFPPISQILGERSENFHEHPIADPFLESAVAGLIRRIFAGQRTPRRARPQHPEDAVEYVACINPRSSLAVATTDARNQRRDDLPLLVGDFHIDV
jgi:hypothetical protein